MTQKQSQTFHANHAAQSAFLSTSAAQLKAIEALGLKWMGELGKVAAFQARTAQTALQGLQAHVLAVSAAKAPQDLVELNSKTLKPLLAQAVEQTKEAQAIVLSGAQEIGKAIEVHMTAAQKEMAKTIGEICEQAPEHAKPFAKVVHNAVQNGQDAMETLQKQVKTTAQRVGEQMRAAGFEAPRSTRASKAAQAA